MIRIGVKDVARAAGVSVGTVSNVLNRPEIVRAETRLLEQGHERIAFAGGPFTLPQIADRLDGARRAMAAAGRPERDLVVLETEEPTVVAGRFAAQRLIGLPRRRRPTAVFCANDVMALGALQQLLLAGVAVPSEVAIVGYDDIDFASAAAVPLTSVRQPRDKLGRTATELLIAETTGELHEHQSVAFVPQLMVRDSTRGKRS